MRHRKIIPVMILVWTGIAGSGCQPHWFRPPVAVVPQVVAAPMVQLPPPQIVYEELIIDQPAETILPGPPLPQVTGPPMAPQFVPQVLPPSVPVPGQVPAPGQVPVPPLLPGQAPGGTASIPGQVPPVVGLPNPIRIPVANDDVAWEQIADVVSDYFQISSERRARRTQQVATEGYIQTAPQGGATILEPLRGDSADSFNRWESTFQTIRRRATVRVTPDAGGYLVGVEVQKELEDLPRPQEATAGQATLRYDGSIPEDVSFDVEDVLESPVWIALGRDVVLEQKMLEEIGKRFTVRN